MDQFETNLTDVGRYQILIDAITDYAIYMLDATGHITSWNPGARRFKGYEDTEVLGRHFSIFYTDEDRSIDLPRKALKTAASQGKFECEGWRVRKDGTRFWAHVVIDPIRSESGELLGFAKITRDLAERRSAENAVRVREEQFRVLIQNVRDYAIYLLDPEGHVSSWNPGAQRIKGYTADEIIGQHFSKFYTEDDRARGEPARALDVAVREGRFEREGWRVRRNGDVFWASVSIAPIHDAGGLVGFTKVTRDLTDVRKAQLDLERAREALFQAQKMEAVGQLTGGVAHDFNNILAAVLGGLEIIHRRLPPDPNITPLLENAMSAAQRGKSLTQRMLAFARWQDLHPETTDLPTLIDGMMELLQRSLGPSVAIETYLRASLRAVYADPHQLELALMNLVMNARDAMPDGGTIMIDAHEAPSLPDKPENPDIPCYVCLSVTDSGEGMDAGTLSRATQPFFTTKGVGKGTGLGLSMVHGFAEQSSGQFILRSRKGAGTIAELWLPAVERVDLRASLGMSIQPAPVRPDASTGAAASQFVVLAVDDDRLALMSATTTLNKLGYKVFTAISGEKALELMRSVRHIDLVITDHTLPDMTGLELVEAIRSEWPDLPVIFGTPTADDHVHRIAKPFCPHQLAQTIATIKSACLPPPQLSLLP